MANMKIEEIEGIGPVSGDKLRAAGVANTDQLLDRAGTRPGRKELVEQSGISASRMLDWVNMADLCRVKGIGAEFAELLKGSGVDTVLELAGRNAENLAEKCVQVNDEKHLTRTVPSAAAIQKWIDLAKDLPRVVEY